MNMFVERGKEYHQKVMEGSQREVAGEFLSESPVKFREKKNKVHKVDNISKKGDDK